MKRILIVLLSSSLATFSNGFFCQNVNNRPKLYHSKTLLDSSNGNLEEARRLREKAQRLKEEAQARQNEKDLISKAEKIQIEQIQKEKLDRKSRYSVEIPILKADGSTEFEIVEFAPKLPMNKSRITACQAYLPLGLILGEDEENLHRVDEVAKGGNGEASGVHVGDILRAVTACQVTMEAPTWQLIAGGIGQPKTKRFMFSVDGVPFEQVMKAVVSNRMDPENRPLWLVLETPEGET